MFKRKRISKNEEPVRHLVTPALVDVVYAGEDPFKTFKSLDEGDQQQILSFLLRNTDVSNIPRADLVVFSRRTLIYNEGDIQDDGDGDDGDGGNGDDGDGDDGDGDDESENSTEDGIGDIRGACHRPVVPDDNGRVDLRHDPYCLRQYFRSQWHRHDTGSACITSTIDLSVSWNSYDLYDADESKTVLGLQLGVDTAFRHRHLMVSNLISSQLLLYRIIANFGHPRTMNIDGYKQCWEVELRSMVDSGILRLSDNKGAPTVFFCGSQETSNTALQLINWLFSDNIPHSYDYTLCESVA